MGTIEPEIPGAPRAVRAVSSSICACRFTTATAPPVVTGSSPAGRVTRWRSRRARAAGRTAGSRAGEERQQLVEELAGGLEVRDMPAFGHHHPRRVRNVTGGLGGKRHEVTEPGGVLRLG